ncbi:T9SS type A sorting domain-containing protein [Flavobacterium sp.]|uniref:RCC1 domain-containing protein n=1 Tax=Flavobacterium sp. TaxID=239 RepID=UPI0039E3E554
MTKVSFIQKTILILLLLFQCTVHAQCWKSVSPGADFCIAIKEDGTLWSWGNNNSGQLGLGHFDNKTIPTRVGSETDWETVSSGYGFVLALKTNGTIWVWGRNDFGLGGNPGSPTNAPSQVGSDSDWKSIHAGGAHSFAIKNNGTLWGWGRNDFGQLGIGTFGHTNIPTQVGTQTDWETVAAGTFHTLAVKTDQTLWSWGYNFSGQLGQGTAGFGTELNVPTLIAALPANAWRCIAAGGRHSMAITETGSLWIWGNNNNFALGLNDGSFYKSVPTRLGNTNNWKFAAGGIDHTLAIKEDQTLWGWGENTDGQLGDHSTIDRPAPVQVGGIGNWTLADGGLQHSLFVKDGEIFTSGGNAYGELGIGSLVGHNNPQPVDCPQTLGTNSYTQSYFTVYPNPVREILTLHALEDFKIDQIQIIDVAGKVILEPIVTEKSIDVQPLQSGFYWLMVFAEGKKIPVKFIKI